MGTRREETGRARLRKYVVTEDVTKTVPVQREEVRIEREPITDANATGDGRRRDHRGGARGQLFSADSAISALIVAIRSALKADPTETNIVVSFCLLNFVRFVAAFVSAGFAGSALIVVSLIVPAPG